MGLPCIVLNEGNRKSGSGKSMTAKRVEISVLVKVPARKSPSMSFQRNFVIKRLLLEARAESRETVALTPI